MYADLQSLNLADQQRQFNSRTKLEREYALPVYIGYRKSKLDSIRMIFLILAVNYCDTSNMNDCRAPADIIIVQVA